MFALLGFSLITTERNADDREVALFNETSRMHDYADYAAELNYHSMAYQYVEMQYIPELHAVALHHIRAYRLYESVLCESVALVNGFH